MKLVTNRLEEPVTVGMAVVDFRGECAVVTGWREPHKPGSTGRVYVREEGGTSDSEYFPGVFGLKFVEE